MTPNPPYRATIIIAILLMALGLSLDGSLFSVPEVNRIAGDVLAAIGIDATQAVGRVLIVASPTLLIIGSLFRGI